MQILINSVAQEAVKTAKGGYKKATVNYVRDGKAETKSIMSFTNPEVFKVLTELPNFPVELEVKTQKNDKGYWDWVSVDTKSSGEPAAAKAPSRVSNYETADERAAKQVMIVRQSSLSTAQALLEANGGKKNTAEDVIEVAKQFEAYVMSKSLGPISEMKDDIPF